MKPFLRFFWPSLLMMLFMACSPARMVNKSLHQQLLKDSTLSTAHIGISVYEPASGQWLVNYQGDHYFVPASNTKIPTCYAAMKYLGDSIAGLHYQIVEDQGTSRLLLSPTGDPGFLQEEFTSQPVLDFLRNMAKRYQLTMTDTVWKDERWGSGWTWNDYDANYVAERSSFPVMGNMVYARWKEDPSHPQQIGLQTGTRYFDSLLQAAAKDWKNGRKFSLTRSMDQNEFILQPSGGAFSSQAIPFVTRRETVFALLEEKIGAPVSSVPASTYKYGMWRTIYSRPADSLFKPMMHRSDNFYAEQSLLMVSRQLLGYMSDGAVINRLLQTEFADLPQKPRWVDGSGLSRYNLFTPMDMVSILEKMRKEIGMERVKGVWATGDEGTLKNYYTKEKGKIYAKTGTLSGVVALSGFLYTSHNRLLLFSVLVNNHNGSATAVRRAVEQWIREVYTRL